MGIKRKEQVSAEFNMSSLTDIIFLLLIFFMLTSNLINTNVVGADIPDSDSTLPSAQTFSVSIKAENEDGSLSYFIDEEKIEATNNGIFEKRLQQRVDKYKAENPEEAEALTIVLNVDKNVPTGLIVNMMQIAGSLGVNMIMSTKPKE